MTNTLKFARLPRARMSFDCRPVVSRFDTKEGHLQFIQLEAIFSETLVGRLYTTRSRVY